MTDLDDHRGEVPATVIRPRLVPEATLFATMSATFGPGNEHQQRGRGDEGGVEGRIDHGTKVSGVGSRQATPGAAMPVTLRNEHPSSAVE